MNRVTKLAVRAGATLAVATLWLVGLCLMDLDAEWQEDL